MNPTTTRLIPFAASLLLLIGGAQANPKRALVKQTATVNSSGLTVAPSAFEENKGQVRTTAGDAAPFVRYRLIQGNTSIFLLENGIAYQFNQRYYPEGYAALDRDSILDPAKQQELDALRKEVRLETYRMDMLLEGANPAARITTEGRSEDYTQYYNHDALDVHTYSRVTYHEAYPGIDWVVYTTAKGMKYDFVVRPGADPNVIQLRFKDQEELYVDAEGKLIHGNRMGRFAEERPVSFQNGKEVGTRFVLEGDRLTFALDGYDQSEPLTIDPERIWATYYGATGYDLGNACTVDDNGNVFLAGTCNSNDAIASGGHQITSGGDLDAFLVKFDANGVRQWGTYYGGANDDEGLSCAVDSNGNVCLAGNTKSENSISTGGHQNAFGGGFYDAFLVKFNSSGVRQWGTYYGAYDDERGNACAVDNSGNIYLAGVATSISSIASGGHQNILEGASDAMLVKFNASGVRQWATYYGGAGQDWGRSCAVDAGGNVYMAGITASANAIAMGGHQGTFGGGKDAYLVKFSAQGTRQWATYYGGTDLDEGTSCAVDESGNVYLAGKAKSGNAIASAGHQNTYTGVNYNPFLVKFSASGTRQWGTYYGESFTEQAMSCVADSSGNIYLAGGTYSTADIASNGHQNTFGGPPTDAFLVKFNTSGARQWGTYYGGTGKEDGRSCAVDGSGNVYLAGTTYSDDSIAFGGHQNVYGTGNGDAFLVKFEGESGTNAIISLDDPQPSFSIWPNPNTGDRFYLQAHDSGLTEVQLFNALGKLQHTEQVQFLSGQAPVEVALGSDLAKGLYMVRITVEGRSSVAPLVVE